MTFQPYNDGYYVNLYLTEYPSDYLTALAQSNNTDEIVTLLDKFNHPEIIEHSIYINEEFRFETHEHYEQFHKKVVDGFISVEDLFDAVLYLCDEENALYYKSYPYAPHPLSTLFSQVNKAMINGYEKRLVAVQYDED